VKIKNGATMDQYFARQKVSTSSTDADTASTFQVTVPPEKILADTTYSVELVECDDSSGTMQQPRFPATGEATLDALKTGGVKITIIPLVSNAHMADTSDATLKIYQAFMEAMYPIDHVMFTVGQPMSVAYPVDWDNTIDQLRMRRQSDKPASDVYYYGMLMPLPTLKEYCKSGCTAGVGYVGTVAQPQTRVALGLAFGDELSAAVMAHEVGHNHGRNHAPCAPGGNISGVDANYPYKDAIVGVWGYDLRNKTFYAPDKAKDIMGYCDRTRGWSHESPR
jgi:uncharacterized protein YutD